MTATQPCQRPARRPCLRSVLPAALLALATALIVPATASAGVLDAVSDGEASGAVRAALTRGADAAVGKLGVPGGFLNNPEVRIPLPEGLRQGERVMRMIGKGAELDGLKKAMNQAAERAVPQARTMLVKAVKAMTVEDAKAILTGGDDSVTQFFRSKTEADLTAQFLPVVAEQVSKLGLARSYDRLAGQGAKFGLVDKDAATMDRYVTARALDGLYLMIAREERALRANPLQAGSQLLGKVFGLLR